MPPTSVLVIDHEPQVMQRLLELFRRAGYAPLLAASTHAAAVLLQTERFDVVVTDDGDERMSAEQLARRLRERSPENAPPVVCMTSAAAPSPSPHFAAVVRRPVDTFELLCAVERVARACA